MGLSEDPHVQPRPHCLSSGDDAHRVQTSKVDEVGVLRVHESSESHSTLPAERERPERERRPEREIRERERERERENNNQQQQLPLYTRGNQTLESNG